MRNDDSSWADGKRKTRIRGEDPVVKKCCPLACKPIKAFHSCHSPAERPFLSPTPDTGVSVAAASSG